MRMRYNLLSFDVSEERSFLTVKCGTEFTAALCVFDASALGEWLKPLVNSVKSWQLSTDMPQGARDSRIPQWMRSVCPVSFGSQRGLSSSTTPPCPRRAPTPGPLCVDPAPCGLAALWPFTCDCVQSPCSPPSEPRASAPISNQLLTLRGRDSYEWVRDIDLFAQVGCTV